MTSKQPNNQVIQQARRRLGIEKRRAVMGDGTGRVYVPGRNGYVYIRFTASGENASGFTPASVARLRANIPASHGLAVLVGYDHDQALAVIEADFSGLEQSSNNPLIAITANPDVNGSVDLNNSPILRSQPVGGSDPLSVSVLPFIYVSGSTVYSFAGKKIDLTSYIPATSNHWGLAGIFLKTDLTVEVITSTTQDISELLDETDIQECVTGSSALSVPVVCWTLTHGMTTIADTDKFWDARQWINVPSSAGATTDASLLTSGTLAAARGGLATDASAFTGLLKMTAGVTSTVTAPSGTVVGTSDAQGLTNKSITASTVDSTPVGGTTPANGTFTGLAWKNSGSFVGAFDHSNTGNRVYSFPNYTATIATLDGTETFTNKSLTTPAIAGATLTGAIDANGATMRAPVTASALTATEGYWKWDSTDKIAKYYDGTRERGASGWGYQPFAVPIGFNPSNAYSASNSLAASSGTMLLPIMVSGHMLLQSVQVLNNDATLARSWRWDLYADINNAANAVTRVATSNGSDAFTATVASVRTLAATSAPVYLPPGAYWLAIQNNHASNTFALGITAVGGTFLINMAKTKTTGGTNGATLDIIAATWANVGASVAASLRGRAAADTVAW